MSAEERNEETYRGIIEAVSSGDAGALDPLMTEDIIDHNPVPDQAAGSEGFKQWMAYARSAFPDFRGVVEDLVAEGDRVAGRVTWSGTHLGPFAGLEPTGRPVEFAAYHIVRFTDGRAAEWWGTADLLGALRRLGATITGPQS